MSSSTFPSLPDFPQGSAAIKVNPGQSNAIGSCIETAPENATIYVPAGEYKECLTINKNIQLIGEGEVILTASQPTDAFTVNANVFVKNIKIQPGSSQCSSAVNLIGGSALFEDCELTSPYMPPIVTHDEGLLYFNKCSISSKEAAVLFAFNNIKVEFRGCTISSPQTVGIIASHKSQIRMIRSTLSNCGDSGIVILDHAIITMDGCTLSSNKGDAIEIKTESQTNSIVGTTIKDHEKGLAINCYGPGKLTVKGCTITNCTAGIVASMGFTIDAGENNISNVSKSALVCATNKSQVTLEKDTLTGKCLLAIISDSGSTVKCSGVEIVDIKTTGSSVTGNGTLSFTDCNFERIQQCAIEAHDNATLEVTNCKFSEIESIGILVQTNVRGFVKDTTIESCDIVGCHFVENTAPFRFEHVTFAGNRGNGLNIKNTTCTFSDCQFNKNASAGIEARGSETKPIFTRCQFNENEEAGVSVTDFALPKFIDCTFSENGIHGCFADQASPALEKCKLLNNLENGLFAVNQSSVNLTDCVLSGNQILGAQVENEGTITKFIKCNISGQPKGGGVIVNDKAKSVFDSCTFTDNNGAHVECRMEGRSTIKRCDLSQSRKGVGLMLQGNGFAEVENTKFHDEQQAGIVVGNEGDCNVQNCDLYECNICAIYLLGGSKGTFKKNHIHDNKSIGIQVQEGAHPSILENTIERHPLYGINVALGAEPQVIDNIFNENGTTDVNRE